MKLWHSAELVGLGVLTPPPHALSARGAVRTPRPTSAARWTTPRLRLLRPAAAWLAILFVPFVIRPSSFAQNPPSTQPPTEAALAELLQPAKKLPFKTVLHATTGHRLLDFDTNNPAHRELHAKLLRAAALAGQRARAEGITTARANEAGNHIEPFVRAALRDTGLAARVPVNADGRAQATGYPDIEITNAPACYLELKTYNATTANTTQRSFYYSPGATPKVTRDALHLLLAYQLEKQERAGKTVFVPVHWRLLSLQDLEVDLKYEFNTHNRALYGQPASALGDGPVE